MFSLLLFSQTASRWQPEIGLGQVASNGQYVSIFMALVLYYKSPKTTFLCREGVNIPSRPYGVEQ